MLLAAVRCGEQCCKLLLAHFRTYTRVYYATFNRADVDISRAYVAVKLWLLLARQSALSDEGDFNTTGKYIDRETTTALTIWNELWPPLEAVASTLEQDAIAANMTVRRVLDASSLCAN